MKVLVVTRDKIENIPPLISVVELLLDLGNKVSVITTDITASNKEKYTRRGVKIIEVPYEIKRTRIQRFINILKYRSQLNNVLKSEAFNLLWVEGGWTVKTSLGIIDKYPFILQISELYDYHGAESVRKAIGKIIHQARTVVMPEENRAVLYRVFYQLNKTPMILPNKPYFYLDGGKYDECVMKYKDKLRVFNEKKVILYQGIIAQERDLSNYIRAVKELGDEYIFVLLGPDRGMLSKYMEIDPSIIHIDFIPAPEYLVFTSKAYIGVLTYDPSTLNCEYCAPNKLFEYGRYGLPMIGNDIPGLKNTIGRYEAGVIVDEESVDSIIDGINAIASNYSKFSNNSTKLYTETDNKANMEKILSL